MRRLAAAAGVKRGDARTQAADAGLELRASLIDSVDEALVAVDADGSVVFMNRAAEDLFGCSAGFALTRALADALPLRLPEGLVASLLNRPLTAGPWTGEVAVFSEDPCLVMLTISPIRVEDQVIALLLSARGRRRGGVLRGQPDSHDEATGLLNLPGVIVGLTDMVEHHDFDTSAVAVIRIELDSTYRAALPSTGRRSAALALASAVHTGDIVGRSSESSFTVCCPHLLGANEAMRFAEGLRGLMADPVALGPDQIPRRAAAGLVMVYRPGDTAEELIHRTGLAVAHRRDREPADLAVYDDALQQQIMREVDIEVLLREAIAADEVPLAYQPVVQITDQAIVGAEALLRMVDDRGDPVPAPEAIEVAERTGLISELGLVVMRTACREAARWQHQHPERAIGVAVNVSASQLHDGTFPDQVEAVLNETGLKPARLTLEMTESVLMANSAQSTRQLARLKMSGVHLSADDFGTGYSSLAYLKRFPLEVIKADLSFVAGLPDSPEDVAIVSAIIAMADAVGLDVVAEGVENIRQLSELERLGCGFGQGYLWSRAVPGDEFLVLLERARAGGAAPRAPVEPATRRAAAAGLDDSLQAVFRTFAHEVRTPLTVMTGWAALLDDADLRPAQRTEASRAIRRAGARIDRLVGSLDDVLALEDGHLELDARPVELRQVVTQLLDDFRPRLSHPIVFDRYDASPVKVHVDVARIEQVLTNLISNAAKFSPPGAPIEVVIGCHGTWADVSVLDQGPGIAEADVALAFRKYGRLGSSHRGLGIGLYLARGITRAHGGEVCYRRRAEPTGSIFNLRLPRGGGPLGLLPERDL
jgi:EAL domain-containing protein (putative c-di-GMP-specific phosphodiesterase class I)